MGLGSFGQVTGGGAQQGFVSGGFQTPFPSASNPISTSTGQMFGPPAPGGPAFGAQAAIKVAKFGLQAFSFANTLSSIRDFKAGATANFARMRSVVRERAAFNTERIEITAFRLLKRQTAQASTGGFAGTSASTLSILNRTETDKDRATTQVNKQLDDALAEIQKQESEARMKARGLKTKAITDFAGSILSNFG